MQISKTLLIGALLLVFQTNLLSADDALNPVDVEVTPLCGKLSKRYVTCKILSGGDKNAFTCTDTGKCEMKTNRCIPNGKKPVFGEAEYPQDDWNENFYIFEDLTKDDQEARKVNQEELDCYVVYTCKSLCMLAKEVRKCERSDNVVSRLQVTKYTKTEEPCPADEPAAPEEPANPGDPGLLDDPNAAIIAMEPAF